MNWGSASEFFHMGGYGLYVWGSYAVAVATMLIEPVLAKRRHRTALGDLSESSQQESSR